MYVFDPNPCWTTLIERAFGEPDFVLPASLREVEESAFDGITATIVYVPDSCISLGDYTFRDAEIIQIRIPAACSVGTDVFFGCDNVTIFGAAGSSAEDYCITHDNCSFIAERTQ